MANLYDIRIGTLLPIHDAPQLVPRLLELGFESFQLVSTRTTPTDDFRNIAASVMAAVRGRAVISSIGYFTNVLQSDEELRRFTRHIEQAELFETNLVVGFTGALDGRPVTDSVPRFKEVWSGLGRQAADRGLRVAFENCEMAGSWQSARMNLSHAPTFWEMMWNAVSPEIFGLCWEPCHQMQSLVDPIPQLRKLAAGRHLFNVHGKDATIAWDIVREYGVRSGKQFAWQHHPGFGDTNWTEVVNILRLNQYVGSIDIEGYHDRAYEKELEWTGQVHALRYLQRCRGGNETIDLDEPVPTP